MFRKTFEVIRNSARQVDFKLGKRRININDEGPTFIDDPGVAHALDQKYGIRKGSDDIMVIPVDNWQTEPGHRYSFSVAALPRGWHDKIDWGKR